MFFPCPINICNLIVAEYNPSQQGPSFLFMSFLIYYAIEGTHNVLRYLIVFHVLVGAWLQIASTKIALYQEGPPQIVK